MINKLRSRHRLLWFPIALLVIIVVIVTGERVLVPLNEHLPGLSKDVRVLQLVDNASVEWENEGLAAQISRSETNELVLSITAEQYINKPDLLVYMNRIGGRALTNESLLVGSFAQNKSQNFVLPDSSLTDGSVFILYSLPKNEVVDVAEVSVTGGLP